MGRSEISDRKKYIRMVSTKANKSNECWLWRADTNKLLCKPDVMKYDS